MKRDNIIIIFLLFFALGLKLLISYSVVGPTVLPQESCIIQKAIYFSEHFQAVSCKNALQVDAPDYPSLYSIFISPIYYFFRGMSAYRVSLLLNNLLVLTLFFPLFYFFRQFGRGFATSLLSSILLLFVPQLVNFEMVVAPTALFLVLNVWLLYFYYQSLHLTSSKARIYKFLAIFLAVLSAITLPFGFVSLIALLVNELVINSNRRLVSLFYTPLALFFLALAIVQFLPPLVPSYQVPLMPVWLAPNWTYVMLVLKSQLFSFVIVVAFSAILIFFLSYFYRKIPLLSSNLAPFFVTFLTSSLIVTIHYLFNSGSIKTSKRYRKRTNYK